MKQYFRLYTWQLPEWDIATQKREPSQGPQRWTEDTWERLQPLYAKLKEKIGTLDFLWCLSVYEHWNENLLLKLWELDVPSSKIDHFLDSKIWESLIQDAFNYKNHNDNRMILIKMFVFIVVVL